MKYLVVIFSVVSISLNSMWAQASSEKAMITHANDLYNKRLYEQAHGYYMKLKDLRPEVVLYQYRAGVCCIYTGDATTAISLLKASYDKDPLLPEINFFLGRAYLQNEQYDDALMQFNLQLAKEQDPAQKTRLQQYVTNCLSAKELAQKKTFNKVENGGRPLNSPADEYSPVLTKADSVLIFTYKGPQSSGGKNYLYGKNDSAGLYYEDVFLTMKTKSGWFYPQTISENINSKMHDAVSAVSADGTTMYVFKSSPNNGGDIYVSKKIGNDWTVPVPVRGDINKADSWEGSMTLSADGKTIYFSSDRAGGFGGKDIYRATLVGDTVWTNIQNLGLNINTALDEDAPFLTDKGYKLYFSSRGHNAIGGYDVFVSDLGVDGQSWQLAQNMGMPINSVFDDIYYQLTADGQKAIYASNRPGGSGMMDLYFADPGILTNERILIKGLVTLDEQPVGAVVTVTYTAADSLLGDYNTSSDNGKYSINLPSGKSYKLFFQVSGQDEYVKWYDASQIKEFTTNEINVEFFSAEYRLKHPEKFGKMNAGDSAKVLAENKNKQVLDGGKKIIMRTDSSKNFMTDDNLTAEPGYYVVIGSFKNKEYAKRLEAKVAVLNKYPKVQRVMNKKNGFMYVTIAHPATKEEAIQIVETTRLEYADAWIQFLE